MDGPGLHLFRPEELEEVVAGVQDLDFAALRGNCSYEGGYHDTHRTIVHFWDVVMGGTLDEERQRQLLKFATGCPRAPLGGLGQLPFKIQRDGIDSEHLPTSHTCFNTLLLPDYGDRDILAQRLVTAIEECEGFGLE